MKVQFILPPSGISFSRNKWMMPLGLLSIATYLKEKMPFVQIEVIDGNIVSEEKIIEKLIGEIIGISINTANFESAKRIGRIVKKNGSVLVAGGSLVTSLGKQIQQKIPEIDVVIKGDGEGAFGILAAGGSPLLIHHQMFLDSLPTIDRTFLNVEQYLLAFQNQYPHSPYRRPFTLYMQKGCRHRQKTGGCKFCSITDRGWRARNPIYVWEEIHMLVDVFGADLIWEVSDSIASNLSWLEKFVSSRPANVNCDFYFYIRADEVSEYTAGLISKINCKRVFIGIESGNDSFLLETNKNCSTIQNLKAAKILNRHNIGIHLSFILGFPGENKKTIENTKRHIKQILPYGVEVLNAHVMTPEPGSQYFTMLSRRISGLTINSEQLRQVWARHFCEIPVEDMYRACEEILAWLPGMQEADYGNVVI